MAEEIANPLDIVGCTDEEIVARLPLVWKTLLEVLDTYLDLGEDERHILACWIIAAPYKQYFEAFPILFINASKGSGKTRLLKLIEALIPESILVVSLTESSLFRMCEVKLCILIDEAERLGAKEKVALKELLNGCYKKGGKVVRVEGDKVKTVKEFSVYNPVALANIWGLESVLADRCITIVLQKSTEPRIINTPEMFGRDSRIAALQTYFEQSLVYVGSCIEMGVLEPVYRKLLPFYIFIHTTLPTLTYTNYDINKFLSSVQECRLDGRNLELWLPFFVVNFVIEESATKGTYTNLFSKILELSKTRSKVKDEDELTSDKDTNLAVLLYTYIHGKEPTLLTKDFITYFEQENGKADWLSAEVLGRFLKRAGVIESKRRLAKGFEFKISIPKLRKYLDARHALEMVQEAPSGQPDLNPVQHQLSPVPSVKCEACGSKTATKEFKGHFICADAGCERTIDNLTISE